jgi:hypothetical protein
MTAISIDKGRLLKIHARKDRAGAIKLRFRRRSDGEPFSIAGIPFEFFVVKHVIGGDKLISLTTAAGDLTVTGDDDDELNILLSAELMALDPVTHRHQLVNLSTVKTWLNGPFEVHAGDFDDFTSEEVITVNTGDVILEVTINDVASPGVDHYRGAFDFSGGFPETGGTGPEGSVRAGDEWFFESDVEDFLGEAQSEGTIAKAKIDNPGQDPANWRLI